MKLVSTSPVYRYNKSFNFSISKGLSTMTIYSLKLTNASGAPINLNKNSTAFLLPLLFHNQAKFNINLLYNSISTSLLDSDLVVPLNSPCPGIGNTVLFNLLVVTKVTGSNPNICESSLTKESGILFFLLYVTVCANFIPLIYFLTSSKETP